MTSSPVLSSSRTSSCADRISAKRGNGECLKAVCHLLSGNGHPDRSSVSQALRKGHQIGFYPPMFYAKPFPACSAKAGLNLIRDKQSTIFFYDSYGDLKIFFRGSNKPSHTLNGLGNKGSDLTRGSRFDEFINIFCTFNLTVGIGCTKLTSKAVRACRMGYARNVIASHFPCRMTGQRHRQK